MPKLDKNVLPKAGRLYWGVCAADEFEARELFNKRYLIPETTIIESWTRHMTDGRVTVYFDVEEIENA